MAKPKTKEGKRRKAALVMREFASGKLRSSSGGKVTNPAQAKAIALQEAGLSRKKKRRK